jgi:hypothetical protein
MPETPEEARKQWLRWDGWYQSMGAAVVDRWQGAGSHTPLVRRAMDNGGANPVSGTIVEADNYVTACKHAASSGCRWQRISGSGESSLIWAGTGLGRNVTWSRA